MRRRAGVLAVSVLLLVVAAVGGDSAQRLTGAVVDDPSAARFVYTDIENFLGAREAIAAGADPAATLERDYLDRGTPGLRMFVEKYDLTVERLLMAMAEHPEQYDALAGNLAALRSVEPEFRHAWAAIRELMPDAVFPPTYFLVGAHRGIGSGSIEGPLISIEKDTPESIRTDLVATLVHEMVHIQQLAALDEAYFEIFDGPGRTLLALCVREGIATYFSELVTGGSVHKNEARDFLLANESRLWSDFERDMLGGETDEWLWSDPRDPAQPRDVGYALGARIAATYYENADDKRQAVAEILGVTDYPAFLERSGYPNRFSR